MNCSYSAEVISAGIHVQKYKMTLLNLVCVVVISLDFNTEFYSISTTVDNC